MADATMSRREALEVLELVGPLDDEVKQVRTERIPGLRGVHTRCHRSASEAACQAMVARGATVARSKELKKRSWGRRRRSIITRQFWKEPSRASGCSLHSATHPSSPCGLRVVR